jgi:ABC-type uncharacterized transport system auxiliary subunit
MVKMRHNFRRQYHFPSVFFHAPLVSVFHVLYSDAAGKASSCLALAVIMKEKMLRFQAVRLFQRSLARALFIGALSFALLLSLSSCISLKSEYPSTVYYRLTESAVTPFAQSYDGDILVKPLTIDSEFDTDQMLIVVGGETGETQILHYHRWTSEPQELLTAHIVNRFQQSGLFRRGVFTPVSAVAPALQLEGRVTEFLATNAAAVPGTSVSSGGASARLRVHYTLQRIDDTGKPLILLQKVYSHTAPRASSQAASIAPAMSEAANAVADSLARDIARILLVR